MPILCMKSISSTLNDAAGLVVGKKFNQDDYYFAHHCPPFGMKPLSGFGVYLDSK